MVNTQWTSICVFIKPFVRHCVTTRAETGVVPVHSDWRYVNSICICQKLHGCSL